MIIKTNRFFGRDISNLQGPASRNSSKQGCQKRVRKLSVCMNENKQSSVQQQGKIIEQTLANRPKSLSLPDNILQDGQCIPEYFTQVFKHMTNSQKNVIGNYCLNSALTDKTSRGMLIDWLIEIHHKFQLFPQTLYIMVSIMDRYLAKTYLSKNKLKLVALCSFYLTAKYQETYRVPQMKDLLTLCNYTYTKKQILDMEGEILNALKFKIVHDCSYKVLQGLSLLSSMNQKNFHLAQYLLELASTQSYFLQYSDSLMACSTFYLVCKIRKVQLSWDQEFYELTSFKQSDLHKCARQLCNLLQKIDQNKFTTSLKKKFSLVKFNQVTKLKLQRKK